MLIKKKNNAKWLLIFCIRQQSVQRVLSYGVLNKNNLDWIVESYIVINMLYKSIVKVKCFNQTKANENNNSNEEYKKRK